MLLWPHSVLYEVWSDDPFDISAINGQCNRSSDYDACIGYTHCPYVESMETKINNWECLEERIVDSVHQRCIYVDEEDSRVLDCDLNGFNHASDKEMHRLDVLLVDFTLAEESLVTSELSQAARPMEKNVR